MRPSLAEENYFIPRVDEDLSVRPDLALDTPDWGSDPMEILMRKQELERLMLEAELSVTH